MTTPSQAPGSVGGVTQNQLTMTQHAADAFQTAVSDLQAIYNEVFDGNIALGKAMSSTSGRTWQQQTAQWSDDFYALKGSLQNITDMLHQQVAQMKANEANNIDLAGGQPG